MRSFRRSGDCQVISRAEAQGLVTEARSEAFLERLVGLAIEVDGGSVNHALSSTLNLAEQLGTDHGYF
jgi:hypothetical protein